jgi:hypothetical protein
VAVETSGFNGTHMVRLCTVSVVTRGLNSPTPALKETGPITLQTRALLDCEHVKRI